MDTTITLVNLTVVKRNYIYKKIEAGIFLVSCNMVGLPYNLPTLSPLNLTIPCCRATEQC